MVTDTNLQFIKDKITQVRTAIMYSLSNELIRLPNSIVEAVNVDDEGNLWFVCKPPMHDIDVCEKSFPARLQFYKKGSFFKMEVSGKATIIDNEYCRYFATDENGKRPLLIKLNMQHIEYTEPQSRRKNLVESWIDNGYKWFQKQTNTAQPEKGAMAGL